MLKKVKNFKELTIDINQLLEDEIKINAQGVKVGFLEGARYLDGTSVADVARKNEYGNPSEHRPPRPFFKQTIAEKNNEWLKIIKQGIKHNKDVNMSLSLAGKVMVADIKQSIISFSDPPNAPYTIKKKGFNNPLIDTKHMLHSVEYEVIL